MPEANKIQQKSSRDFHVDLTQPHGSETKSCETSSWEPGLGCCDAAGALATMTCRLALQCLTPRLFGGLIGDTSYDWHGLVTFSPLESKDAKTLATCSGIYVFFLPIVFAFLGPDDINDFR